MKATPHSLRPPETLRDRHTNAYTFPVFDHLLEWQIRRAVRYQEAFALLCVALDPSGNDAANGDEEAGLEIVAENIRKEIRETDLIGRTGQTLLMLLLYAGNGDAPQIAERIRARIENYAFLSRSTGKRIRQTVSIGGTCFPLDAVDRSPLMKKAMSCLRRAREEGGNRVILSGSGS